MLLTLKEKPKKKTRFLIFSPKSIGPGSRELYEREGFATGDICELLEIEIYQGKYKVYYVRNTGKNREEREATERIGRTSRFHESFFY